MSPFRIGPRAVSIVAAAWVLSLGFDVFLHGGLLARMYAEPSPFLLAPEEAFRRIPLGYMAFLGLTAALYWLFRRLGVRGAAAGFRYGAVAGAVVWGALAIGLYSISTAEQGLLAGWWAGQTIELGLAGAVIGAAGSGVSSRRIWTVVVAAVTGVRNRDHCNAVAGSCAGDEDQPRDRFLHAYDAIVILSGSTPADPLPLQVGEPPAP